MRFNTLKERMEYFRSLTDYKLMPNSYVIVMLDGHGFSKTVKRLFRQPFDDAFIDMMNGVAKYLCENVQCVKTAFVQSDEISLVLNDFETDTTESFFAYRLCKLQSVIAGMASTVFNDLYIEHAASNGKSISELMKDKPKFHFDCRAWNVPTDNDAFAWMLYRQNDCIRNSKQQAAQTYLKQNVLENKNTDEQIAALLDIKQIDWNSYDDGKKYGRILKKIQKLKETPTGEQVYRNEWVIKNATPFAEHKEQLKDIINGKQETKITD